MYPQNNCFTELIYEAEVTNTKEDPELLEIAAEQCNENPATRAAAIEEFRQMIYERGECEPLRTDDAYLLRFLRSRAFVVPRAHRLLVRYCQFREQYPDLYKGVDLWGLIKVKDAYEGTGYDWPDMGRITIMRFGAWDPSEFPIRELLRACMAMTEISLRQPKLQVTGATAIFDLEGTTLRHVAALTPTIAYQIVCLMGVAMAGCLKSCHIINYSWILNTSFYIFKRFIPQEMYRKTYFHGYDIKSLQKHIDIDCLPPRYGGTCRNHAPFGTWLSKIKKYSDKAFVEDMKLLGYLVKE